MDRPNEEIKALEIVARIDQPHVKASSCDIQEVLAYIKHLEAQPPPPETKGEAIDKIDIARIAGEIAGIAEGTAFIFKNSKDAKYYIGQAVESLMTIRRLAMSLYSAPTLRNPLIVDIPDTNKKVGE